MTILDNRTIAPGAATPRRRIVWAVLANLAVVGGVALVVALVLGSLFTVGAETAPAGRAGPLGDQAVMWGFMAAALATGIGSLGAAYAVGHVGAAAVGAMGERPEIAGRALIFVGLAEGVAIYGLIVAIMILGRLG
ncbi:ATP synthase subunit C [Candidatus Binatia bacterium]|nr:ATP synthase subunit C [Candidatus Binatia bacterium]